MHKENLSLFYIWSEKYLRALLLFVLLPLIIGSIIVYLRASYLVVPYFLYVFVPIFLAAITVTISLYRSGYIQVVGELCSKRSTDPTERAGMGVIKSNSGKILMNLQKQPPWEGMWLLPAGYFNKDKDTDLRKTAIRRANELTGKNNYFKDAAKIGQTNGSLAYKSAVAEYGHIATEDEIYHILVEENAWTIQETDVDTSNILRWFSLEDIKEKSEYIPPHVKDIARFMLDPKKDTLNYWTVDQIYSDIHL